MREMALRHSAVMSYKGKRSSSLRGSLIRGASGSHTRRFDHSRASSAPLLPADGVLDAGRWAFPFLVGALLCLDRSHSKSHRNANIPIPPADLSTLSDMLTRIWWNGIICRMLCIYLLYFIYHQDLPCLFPVTWQMERGHNHHSEEPRIVEDFFPSYYYRAEIESYGHDAENRQTPQERIQQSGRTTNAYLNHQKVVGGTLPLPRRAGDGAASDLLSIHRSRYCTVHQIYGAEPLNQDSGSGFLAP
ncbi:uncharacterized protein LY89DRAFT_438025 [Mollisia scopiformis]|uniref:Uncharacterized protein n=1 Tax=Mollisia scopiformis TaxID=149040 RepID=A0A194XJB2_MOLSC|nr:uncharacterized protein LY89DRAFT_438025 [Mollisia scopiformis]KUJ20248.1 hypothetical protein LY89DRAFT_438025 [Mollisia scopiformis]